MEGRQDSMANMPMGVDENLSLGHFFLFFFFFCNHAFIVLGTKNASCSVS